MAIIAGLAIFPVVFANDLNFEAGAGIFFTTIPTALSNAPGGMIVGAAFFFLAFFAAITSSVSLCWSPPSRFWQRKRRLDEKAKSAWVTGDCNFGLLGLGSLYNGAFFGVYRHVVSRARFLHHSLRYLIVIFTGWRLNKAILAQELAGPGEGLGKFIMFFVRWVAPIFMGLVLFFGIVHRWIAPLFAG